MGSHRPPSAGSPVYQAGSATDSVYTAVSTAEAIRHPGPSSAQAPPASMAAEISATLLEKPASGGMPISDSEATRNAAKVTGIRRPRPRISATWVFPV